MTHLTAIQKRQDDEALEDLDADEIAGPLLAAIQHSYEEAKAYIEDLAPSSSPAIPHGTEPPGTEKIDLRLVGLPAVPAAPTAAMSLAAMVVAEQHVSDGVGSYAASSGPRPERQAASAPQKPVARAPQDSPDLATAVRRGRATVTAMISKWFPGSAAVAGG